MIEGGGGRRTTDDGGSGGSPGREVDEWVVRLHNDDVHIFDTVEPMIRVKT